ncbi:MAG: hypothetical protein AVDCRST_MAG06-2349, partial [uncultured Nocardioides sp.]
VATVRAGVRRRVRRAVPRRACGAVPGAATEASRCRHRRM